jgi:hypothetical protein
MGIRTNGKRAFVAAMVISLTVALGVPRVLAAGTNPAPAGEQESADKIAKELAIPARVESGASLILPRIS